MSAADAASLKFWSEVSLVGIWLVLVGVVMEGAELFVSFRAWLRRKDHAAIWMKPPEPKVPKWAHMLDKLGWVILVVGLVLEWRGHVNIEEITERETRRLNTELAAATQNSGAAILKAAQLESENLAVRTDLAKLEAANLALEQQIQPRRITPEQRKEMIEFLSKGPKGKVEVEHLPNDIEARVLAVQIREILQTAGFDVNTNFSLLAGGPVAFGVVFTVSNNSPAPPHAVAVSQTFNQQNIGFAVAVEPSFGPGHFGIFIGAKPPPDLPRK